MAGNNPVEMNEKKKQTGEDDTGIAISRLTRHHGNLYEVSLQQNYLLNGVTGYM